VPVIYAIGLDSDRTFRHFVTEADRRGVEIVAINLLAVVAEGSWHIVLPDDGSSSLIISGSEIRLNPTASYYCRILDLSSVQEDLRLAMNWRGIVAALGVWLDHIPGRVINRPSAYSDNFAKPLHEYTLEGWGFNVPASLTSSDPQRLADFARMVPTIVKPVSGVRADSRRVQAEEFADFRVEQGPVHLQRYIEGSDVRVHVVGEAVHAELIRSPDVDYRSSSEASPTFSSWQIPKYLSDQLILTTAACGLAFAGWDFKLDAEGTYWCLEVNPMPGYDGYDRRLGHCITDSLLGLLMGTNAV
jgi:hypothetical protein